MPSALIERESDAIVSNARTDDGVGVAASSPPDDVLPSYTQGHRLYEYGGITLGAACGLALLSRVTRIVLASGFSPAVAVVAVVAGIALADLMSGTLHWAFDTWGTPRTPVLGALAIRTFREHHVDPKKMLIHDFVETNGHNFALSVVVSSAGLMTRVPFVSAMLLASAIFVAMTSQIHKWAHSENPPAAVRALQRTRILLSPDHHLGHHVGAYTQNYCITTGWLDAPLRILRIWETLETVITRVTGAPPRRG